MRVLKFVPMNRPYATEIDGTLESMQKAVGGYIETFCPFQDGAVFVFNDEAQLDEKAKVNRILPGCDYAIKGNFFICGINGSEFTDLPPELMRKYLNELWSYLMLSCGLISLSEFHKLSDINFDVFSPLFAEITPKSLDFPPVSSKI